MSVLCFVKLLIGLDSFHVELSSLISILLFKKYFVLKIYTFFNYYGLGLKQGKSIDQSWKISYRSQ